MNQMGYKGWRNTLPNLGDMVTFGKLGKLMSYPIVVFFQVKKGAARERGPSKLKSLH